MSEDPGIQFLDGLQALKENRLIQAEQTCTNIFSKFSHTKNIVVDEDEDIKTHPREVAKINQLQFKISDLLPESIIMKIKICKIKY